MGKLNKGREEMNIWVLVASIFLLSISWWFTFFQLSELKKKFKILQERLAKRDGVFGTLIYEGSFKTFKKSPLMRNIVIRSSNNFPDLLTGYLMFQNCGG
ncbi:MAG: hypothetical protein WAX66_04205, partial [Patescibacteria group bacterium]